MAKTLKIADLSKDFGLKTKDVVEIFRAMGIEKNSGGSVSDTEFECFVERVTSAHQIKNIDAYLDGEVSITAPKPEKKPTPAKQRLRRLMSPSPSPKRRALPRRKREITALPRVSREITVHLRDSREIIALPRVSRGITVHLRASRGTTARLRASREITVTDKAEGITEAIRVRTNILPLRPQIHLLSAARI